MRKLSLVVLALAVSLSAASIQNTFTGSGSGSIGQTSFSDAAFTIVALGQTSGVSALTFGNGYALEHQSASITIEGVGTFDFLTPTRTFVNNDVEAIGFARGPDGTDLFNFDTVPGADTWDMLSSFSHSGFGFLLQWADTPVNTTGGVLVFESNGEVMGSFTSTVGGEIPEPSSVLLVSTAGLAFFFLRRR